MYFREDPNSAVNYMAKVALCFISYKALLSGGLEKARLGVLEHGQRL